MRNSERDRSFLGAIEAFENGDVISLGEVAQVENEQSYVIVRCLLYLRDEVGGVEHMRIISLKNRGTDGSRSKA